MYIPCMVYHIFIIYKKVMLLITEVFKYEESELEYSCGVFGRPTSPLDFPASVLEPGSGGRDQRSKIED